MAYGELYPTTQFQPSLLGDGLGGTGYQAGESSFMQDYWANKAAREAAFQRPQGQYTSYGLTDPNAPDPATETNQTGVSGALAANQDVYGPRAQPSQEGDGWDGGNGSNVLYGGGGSDLLSGILTSLSDVFNYQPYLDAAMGKLPQGVQNTMSAWGGLLGGNEAPDAVAGPWGEGLLNTGEYDADYLDRDYMTPGKLSAENWDLAQKGLGLGGAALASSLTPVGMIAGQYGRGVANDAYREAFAADKELGPYRGDIGFWEDVLQPDILFGSPEDQQREAYIGAMVNADARWAAANPNVTPDWAKIEKGVYSPEQRQAPKSLLDPAQPEAATESSGEGWSGPMGRISPENMAEAQYITDNALWSPLSVMEVAAQLANPNGSFKGVQKSSPFDPNNAARMQSGDDARVKADAERARQAAIAAAQLAAVSSQYGWSGGSYFGNSDPWGGDQSSQGGYSNTSTGDGNQSYSGSGAGGGFDAGYT